jgi:tRNA dimethylallyltransferase
MKGKQKKSKQKIVVIVGPTATGKSDLAVQLARKMDGEVISADSRQVYRGLNIGTGKITKKEMRGVPHYLLDVADPRRRFSVAEYKRLAEKKIDEIVSRGHVPIICGGTGFYIQAVIDNINSPDVPPNRALRKKLAMRSVTELFAMLKKRDPVRAKAIDRHNKVRLIRALEIVQTLGKVPSVAHNTKPSPFDPIIFGLKIPENKLKEKIKARLIKRLEGGMITEAKKLHSAGLSWKRMEELGLEYRYLSRYLRGQISKAEMIAALETEIWHYAKRQMTWFKRDKRIIWLDPKNAALAGNRIKNFMCGR